MQSNTTAADAALGNTQIEFPPPSDGKQQAYRRERYVRRQLSARWLVQYSRDWAGSKYLPLSDDEFVKPVRVASCRWRLAGADVAVVSDDVKAGYRNLEHCSSIWACPCCSAVIRSQRAKEIMQAVETHQARGGHLVFVTLTLRHKKHDPLVRGLDAVMKGWQKLVAGAPWKRVKDRLGVVGFVRSTEITLSVNNGWHPHIHALLFVDQEPSADQLAYLDEYLGRRWPAIVERQGGRVPEAPYGWEVQAVDKEGKVLGLYLGKLQEERQMTSISSEMARFDIKQGRGGSIVPFQLLDDELDYPGRRGLWLEFYVATRGRRAITWSKGIRDELDLGDEVDDDQIVDDELKFASKRFFIPGKVYDKKVKNDAGLSTAILDLVEAGQSEVARRLVGGYVNYECTPLHGRAVAVEDDKTADEGVKRTRETVKTGVCRVCGGRLSSVLAGEGVHLMCNVNKKRNVTREG